MFVDIVGGPYILLAILWWWAICLILGLIACKTVVSEQSTRGRILRLAIWLAVLATLFVVSEGAQHDLARLFYLILHPGVSSAGIWCTFPAWPAGSAILTALLFLLSLLRFKNKKRARTSGYTRTR